MASDGPSDYSPALELRCWKILLNALQSDITLPRVEEELQSVFEGSAFPYVDKKYREILAEITSIEDSDTEDSLFLRDRIHDQIDNLSYEVELAPRPTIPAPSPPSPPPSPPSPSPKIPPQVPPSTKGLIPSVHDDPFAFAPQMELRCWEIMLEFATTNMTLPAAEGSLKAVFDRDMEGLVFTYVDARYRPMLEVITASEDRESEDFDNILSLIRGQISGWEAFSVRLPPEKSSTHSPVVTQQKRYDSIRAVWSSAPYSPELDGRACQTILKFAATETTLPQAEAELISIYRDTGFPYVDAKFRPYLAAITGMEPEDRFGQKGERMSAVVNELALDIKEDRAFFPSITNRQSSGCSSAPSSLIPGPSSASQKPTVKLTFEEYKSRKKQQSNVIPIARKEVPPTQPIGQTPGPSTAGDAMDVDSDIPPSNIRAFDGRVGSFFPQHSLFVTSPNMDVVHAPLAMCKTRMRADHSFGKDDPLFWPQPFHRSIGHLAVIPCVDDSPDHPLRWAWHVPKSEDFEAVNIAGLSGIVQITKSLHQNIRRICNELLSSLVILPIEIRQDGSLVQGRDRVRKLLDRLTVPDALNTSMMLVAYLQRVFLELYARVQWLQKWVPRLKDVDRSFPLDTDVIGAFVGDADAAADLFRVGIPLWYVRDIKFAPLARIDKVVRALDEDCDNQVPLRGSFRRLDASDSVSAHPVVYTGLPGHFSRYLRMGTFIAQQFSYSLVGSFEGPSQSTALATGSSNPPSVSSPHPNPPAVPAHRIILDALDVTKTALVSVPRPAKRQRTSKKPPSDRNGFFPLKHNDYPAGLAWWESANSALQEFHGLTGPALLKHPVPDPSLLLTPQNVLKPSFLLAWLRIRRICILRISQPNPKWFNNRRWRALLEIADGMNMAGSQGRREEMMKELDSLVKECREFGVTLDTKNLARVPAMWGERVITLDAAGNIDQEVCQQVVWELFEIKFRHELFALDKWLVPKQEGDSDDAVIQREAWYQRELLVYRCFPGLAYKPMEPGFSSHRDHSYRVEYVRGLYNLMRGWPGPKPAELNAPFPDEDDQFSVLELEEAMAHYYVRKFLVAFQRPATIPHICPQYQL
ncbi:hypothetical protein DFH05DRAFT_1457453 [Lentinula detonsa]|uniref:Uncharacterized protein n=1 Tax=Lentinula detonsa TaxID=2804962 RepID=A0A9W8P4N4_9AGAR|nr:hypothetical protein DFH05DRAFT_1530409 [Lentinula detonsa]KAJ3747001.1 hypothetical protein DFH05DRAFT_1457453 [Lentinula detonsa]